MNCRYHKNWNRSNKYQINIAPAIYESDPSIGSRLEKILALSCISTKDKEICESFHYYWRTKGKQLTSSQYKYFCVIEKKYSQEYLDKNESFSKRYKENKELQENFKICCEYYYKTRYWMNIVEKYLNNKSYEPSFEEYERLCENKYALKLLAGYRDIAKFNVGDLVSAKYKVTYHTIIFSECAIVLVPNVELPDNPVKGSKKYKIQCLTTGKQIIVEERHMKKLKVKKEK